MKIRRTIPPAAAPLGFADLVHGLGGMLLPGRYERRLMQGLRSCFKVRHVFTVSSGKAALTVILRALKTLSPSKTEVMIPAYTCFSVPSAIVKAGLDVKLCDIDVSTFDFDIRELQTAFTEKTLCVVPGHLFGIPCDIDAVRDRRPRGVFIVEDAAQAMGGATRGRKLGMLGDVGFFSLGRGKNLTCGSGGIILTNSDQIAGAVEREYARLEKPRLAEESFHLFAAALLALFVRPSLYWLPAQLPFLKLGETVFFRDFRITRLSGMQAGLLRRWRWRLERANRARRENTAYFGRSLGLHVCNGLPRPLLRLPVLAASSEDRNSIISRACGLGLGIGRMYPEPINEIAEIRDRFRGQRYRGARRAADTLFTLPTHELLSKKDKQRIVRFVKNNLGGQSIKEDFSRSPRSEKLSHPGIR